MAFEFERNESVAKNIRRIARERIDSGLEQIHCISREAEAVHNVRKDIKRLRALLRLVRDSIGERLYRHHMKQLRVAADLLAPVREASVNFKTFLEVAPECRGEISVATRSRIRRALLAEVRKATQRSVNAECRLEVEKALNSIGNQISKWRVRDEWESLGRGLQSSYRNARKCFSAARQQHAAEDFHRWRKRTKDLWYQLRLFCPIWPRVVGSLSDELETLEEILGKDHDLAVLQECLARLCVEGKSKDVHSLASLMARRQKKLRAKALCLGRRLYAEKPSVFCNRMKLCWQIWQRDG